MNKNRHITNKTFVLTATVGGFVIMAMMIFNSLWASRQIISATDDAVSAVSSFYLDAMADRRAKTVTNLINSNFDHMEKALPIFANEGIETQEDLRNTIGKITSLLSLSRFALINEDNIVYTQYTTYTGGSRHEFLNSEKMDSRIISTVSLYGSSKQLCLAIPANDLTLMGQRFKACLVQIDFKDIVDLLAFDDQGRTYFGLYSSTGANLSDTGLGPVILEDNILEATKSLIPSDKWETLKKDFENGTAGSMYFSSSNSDATLSYVPIPDTDWQMVVLIRESVIHGQIRSVSEQNRIFSTYQIIFTVITMMLFAGILMLMLRSISMKKLEEEKENSKTFLSLANTDALTGIRNKHSYSEAENLLNQKIREGQIGNLAVVVCDINGLKHVNDTQGHSAGDKLIKDASAMICSYFKHGSVFRVGGDEFVVLLQGTGFDTMDEVINAFNQKTEANIITKDVVVSIGYSTLESGDRQLRDVFERADQMMYERKQTLKAMGAYTRD